MELSSRKCKYCNTNYYVYFMDDNEIPKELYDPWPIEICICCGAIYYPYDDTKWGSIYKWDKFCWKCNRFCDESEHLYGKSLPKYCFGCKIDKESKNDT